MFTILHIISNKKKEKNTFFYIYIYFILYNIQRVKGTISNKYTEL